MHQPTMTRDERAVIGGAFDAAMRAGLSEAILRLRQTDPARYNKIIEDLARAGALGGGTTHGELELSTR